MTEGLITSAETREKCEKCVEIGKCKQRLREYLKQDMGDQFSVHICCWSHASLLQDFLIRNLFIYNK